MQHDARTYRPGAVTAVDSRLGNAHSISRLAHSVLASDCVDTHGHPTSSNAIPAWIADDLIHSLSVGSRGGARLGAGRMRPAQRRALQ